MFIYINLAILAGSKNAKLGSKNAPNPEVTLAINSPNWREYCAKLGTFVVQI